jgi:ABC-type oligopeptide transport system ATPase subunit
MPKNNAIVMYDYITFTELDLDPGKSFLQVVDFKVHFPIRRGFLQHTVGHVRAVAGVSLSISAGRTPALVGESGCAKTTVGKSLLQLIQPTAGSVMLGGLPTTTSMNSQTASASYSLSPALRLCSRNS